MKITAVTAVVAVLLFCGVGGVEHPAFIRPLLSVSLPKPVSPKPRLSPNEAKVMVSTAALRHNVPATLVRSIMAAESNFYPGALSGKGAIGLMQLMPQTARQYGVDPNIPAENVDGGAHYLRVLMTRYRKSNDWLRRVIAAYNAGPGAVDRYRGTPPYRETRAYVGRVLAYMQRFRKEG